MAYKKLRIEQLLLFLLALTFVLLFVVDNQFSHTSNVAGVFVEWNSVDLADNLEILPRNFFVIDDSHS